MEGEGRGGGGSYWPQRSWAKVIFLQACVCPQGGGVSASVHAGIPTPPDQAPPGSTPPRPGTTPGSRHPPDQAHPPPGSRHPPPPGSRLQHTVNERFYFIFDHLKLSTPPIKIKTSQGELGHFLDLRFKAPAPSKN